MRICDKCKKEITETLPAFLYEIQHFKYDFCKEHFIEFILQILEKSKKDLIKYIK